MQPTKELYYKYAGVITAVAQKYAKACPTLADDLFLQAQYVFCNACLSYDPDNPAKASFKTWLSRQLQSLTTLIRSESRGPTHTNIGSHRTLTFTELENSPSAGSLARNGDALDVDMDTAVGLNARDRCMDDYSDSLALEDEYPAEMRPYFDSLRGDALRVFRDYCNGCFDKAPGSTRSNRKTTSVLTPRKLYFSHYAKYGWSFKRVSEALRTLKGVLHAYTLGKLPSIAENPEFSAVQDSIDLFCNA